VESWAPGSRIAATRRTQALQPGAVRPPAADRWPHHGAGVRRALAARVQRRRVRIRKSGATYVVVLEPD